MQPKARGDRAYAVNGAAKQAGGFDNVNEIWKSDGNGLKINIGPIVDAGLALC